MAETRAAAGLTPEQWDSKFFMEYIQENPFSAVMGTNENSIIQIKEGFNKGSGTALTIPLVNRLTGAATTGSNILEGNEEGLDSRSFRFTIDKRRKAVLTPEMEEWNSAIDIRNAAKEALKTWSIEDVRDRIITALGSISTAAGAGNAVAFSSASEAQKDQWLTDNNDRVLFGALKSNSDSTGGSGTNGGTYDMSDSLANIDNTDDKLTPSALSLMKRLALANRSDNAPKVHPIRVGGKNRRYFKVYAGSRTFRDLKDNAIIQQAQREVTLQEENNRLFQGGDLYWDGMIIHEVDDIPVYAGVGAGSIDVSPVYLVGAQAIAYGIGRRYRTRTKISDYGDKYGCAIEAIDGIHKITFGTGEADTASPRDHGVVTGFFAAVDDS